MMDSLFLGLSTNMWVIIGAALVTYLTRFGGYLIIARYKVLHPRVEAGLEAVPAAVLTSIVVPAILTGGWAEIITVFACILLSFRLSLMPMFTIGWALIAGLRYLGL